MSRFHLHLYNGEGHVPDEQGVELADLATARHLAVDGIRSIISSEAREGNVDLRGRIEIAEPSGAVLAVVSFADAIRLRLPEVGS